MAEAQTDNEQPAAPATGDWKLVWSLTVGAFFLLSLWPLWSQRFPPMQDYPQHLMQSHVLRYYHDSRFDYPQYFDVRIQPVYAAFHGVTLVLSWLVPVEVAGKLTLSLYPALIALLVWRLGRRMGKGIYPWGALLFFPLAFNQQYFLGNENYFLSLPLLVLVLLDYEDFLAEPLRPRSAARHFLWGMILFVTHPFTFLIGAMLMGIAALVKRRVTERWVGKILFSLGGMVFLFLALWIWNHLFPPLTPGENEGTAWLSPRTVLEFFTMMFTGMKRWSEASAVDVVMWLGILGVVLGAGILDWQKRRSLPVLHLIFLGVGMVALFALPFRMILFTYINLRVAVVVYFLLALVAAQVRFGERLAACLVGLVILCLVLSLTKQARISAEFAELTPLIEKMHPNARILPLVFDNDSPELDEAWFDIHLHDHNYYHVLVGGGFNPYQSPSPLTPVHYKPGAQRPSPGEYSAGAFSWKLQGADYQYFLLRAPPAEADGFMRAYCNLVGASGKWVLYERKTE